MTLPLTAEEKARLRAAFDAAIVGPWKRGFDLSTGKQAVFVERGVDASVVVCGGMNICDAELVVLMQNSIIRLLDAYEALEAENVLLRDQVALDGYHAKPTRQQIARAVTPNVIRDMRAKWHNSDVRQVLANALLAAGLIREDDPA
jgi:hypothetical protein